MDTKRIVLWIVIAVLAVVVIYVAFFRGGGGVDQSTVSSVGQVAKSSYSGMVGGC